MKKIILKSFEVKDLQNKQDGGEEFHYVTFYAVKWGLKDLQGDIFERGSIYIDENEYKVKHFLNHNFDIPIGKIVEIKDDEVGLLVTSRLSNTDEGRRVYQLYKEGIINEHSVTIIIKDGVKQNDGSFLIKKAQLLEVSTITSFAAQPKTEVVSLKGLYNKNNKKLNKNRYMKNFNHNQKSGFNKNQNSLENRANEQFVQKATEQEVQLLMEALQPLQETVNALQDSVANLQSTVNSLQIEGRANSDAENMESLSAIKFIKDNNILREKGLKRFNTKELIKKKNILIGGNANYTEYRGLQNTRGYADDLIYRLNLINVDRIDIGYTILDTMTFPNNIGTNCYTSTETDISWQRYTSTLRRVTSWTDYCEDIMLSMGEQAALDKLSTILIGQVHRTLANDVWNTVNTNGTNATTTASWTQLANQITECTIFDLLTIHSGDMVQSSNGIISGANVIMVLNPIDFTRLKTSKTVANYSILTTSDLNSMGIFQSNAVPLGNYMVLATDVLEYYLYDSGEVNIIQSPNRPQDGIFRMYITMRGLLALHTENSNAAIYGNIANAIANYGV